MNVHLTFADIVKLAANRKLEKDGFTVTLQGLPMLIEITYDPRDDTGKVQFWLKKEDAKSG